MPTRPDIIRLLSSPKLVAWLMPALMVLLVVGTVAQRYVGLYAAESTYFSSFIFWAGFIPLPGGYSLLGLLALGLLTKTLFKSPWKAHKAGVIITHMGALLLMGGALLTAFTAEEGAVVLGNGETSGIISDYHARELAVYRDGKAILHLPFHALKAGRSYSIPESPLQFTLSTLCRHCTPVEKTNPNGKGVAAKATLTPAPLMQEDEENRAGAMFTLSGADGADGDYLTLESAANQPEFTAGEKQYRIVMQRQQRELPFRLTLEEFKKTVHPGTGIAASYSSTVTVHDGEVSWPFTIRMNHPLRYRGYTLYQSSFIETDKGEQLSVLAAVKNQGRVFPYVASLVMCAGLILQCWIGWRRK